MKYRKQFMIYNLSTISLESNLKKKEFIQKILLEISFV